MKQTRRPRWYYGLFRAGPLKKLVNAKGRDTEGATDAFKRFGVSNIAGVIAALAVVMQFKLRGLDPPNWAYIAVVAFCTGTLAGWTHNTLIPLLRVASTFGMEIGYGLLARDRDIRNSKGEPWGLGDGTLLNIEKEMEDEEEWLFGRLGLVCAAWMVVTMICGWLGLIAAVLLMEPISQP